MSILPLEIIETIIDIVAQDDPQFSLVKTCALVCHEFLHLCRKHIFASIALNAYTDKRLPSTRAWETEFTSRLFQCLLFTTPEIADYIRNLRYWPRNEFEDFSRTQLVEKITRLKTLSIWNGNVIGLKWDAQPIRPTLLHLIHLPTLTSLTICNVHNFVITDLLPCINLQHFKFEFLSALDTNDIIVLNLPDSPLRLSDISYGCGSVSAVLKMCAVQRTDGKPFIDFDCVKKMSVHIYKRDDIHAAHNLFSRCRQLTSVGVDVQHSDDSDGVQNISQIGLSKILHPSMHTLKHLRVETHHATRNATQIVCDNFLASLSSELESMENNNAIETITIKIYSYLDWCTCERANNKWDRLDAALAQLGWPKLERISLTIQITSSYGFSSDEGVSALQNVSQVPFRIISSNKSLLFEFIVRAKSLMDRGVFTIRRP